MSKFKEWIIDKLGYEPRQIDLANELGEVRGELVRKWFKGITYPNDNSIKKIAIYLNMTEAEVKKSMLEIRIQDLEG